MTFFFGCLASTWIGRKIGWGLSRSLLYTSNWAVCIVLCLAWATGVAYAVRLFILAMQPGLLLKIFGYGAGAYISIPNYGLFQESSLPDYGRQRHDFIRGVPSIVYIVSSVVFAFAVSPPSSHTMADQFGSLGWMSAVLISAVIILAVASCIMLPLMKRLEPRLSRLPIWIRWVLVLPTAFLTGLIAEVVPRVLFAVPEIIVNHTLLFRPGFDMLIWQVWAPLIFVIAGVQMAPAYKFATFVIVGGLKIAVAAANLVQDVAFVRGGGPWTGEDPITNSPVWWNSVVSVLCIAILAGFGYLLAKQAIKERTQRSIAPITLI